MGVDQLLACPAGCAFVLLVDEANEPLDRSLTVPNVFRLACGAVAALGLWTSDHLGVVAEILEAGRHRRDLAERILEHPLAQWWFEPLDRAHQMRVGSNDDVHFHPIETPVRSSRGWELYAQKPESWVMTSTTHADSSSVQTCMQSHMGDWQVALPLRRDGVVVSETSRVFEIEGHQAWHRLCVEHPAVHASGNRIGPYDFGALVPDWASVAERYDGVHLCFGGLLTSHLVRSESNEGWTMLFWNAEMSLWLREVFEQRTRLPDADQSEETPWIRSLRPRGTPLRRKR